MSCSVLRVILIPVPKICIYLSPKLCVLDRVPVCVIVHDMRFQFAGRRERLVARLADMWLLPRMRAHVLNQVAGSRERLVARLADMWLLPQMRAHVHCQKVCVCECLAALHMGTLVPLFFVLLPKGRPHVNQCICCLTPTA